MQQLYKSKQQHGSNHIIQITSIEQTSQVSQTFITETIHISHISGMETIKIISVIMYSSLQFIINIIKVSEATQRSSLMVICDNRSQTVQVLGSDLTRYGEWDSSPREW